MTYYQVGIKPAAPQDSRGIDPWQPGAQHPETQGYTTSGLRCTVPWGCELPLLPVAEVCIIICTTWGSGVHQLHYLALRCVLSVVQVHGTWDLGVQFQESHVLMFVPTSSARLKFELQLLQFKKLELCSISSDSGQGLLNSLSTQAHCSVTRGF